MGFQPFSLDQLTIFVAVIDHGSFSAAGRHLGRVQSAISYAVASLEEKLGAPLFDRSGHTPALTMAGRRLEAEARLVLAQARTLDVVAASIREGLEPELSVAVDPIFPLPRLAAACSDFNEAFPQVPLRIYADLLGDALQRVLEGGADLGLCNLLDRSDDAHILRRPAGRVRMVPVCAPSHRLASEARPHRADRLRSEVQVVLTERRPGAADQGVLGARTWRVTDMRTKVALLIQGVGWGSLPEDEVLWHLERGALVELEPEPWPIGGHEVPMHVIASGNRPLGPAASWLLGRLSAS